MRTFSFADISVTSPPFSKWVISLPSFDGAVIANDAERGGFCVTVTRAGVQIAVIHLDPATAADPAAAEAILATVLRNAATAGEVHAEITRERGLQEDAAAPLPALQPIAPELAFTRAIGVIAGAVSNGSIGTHGEAVEAAFEAALQTGVDPQDDAIRAAASALLGPAAASRGWSPTIVLPAPAIQDRPDFPFLRDADQTPEQRAAVEASWFALAFILPRDAFGFLWATSGGDPRVVARAFQVQTSLAVSRALDLGLIAVGDRLITDRLRRLEPARQATWLADVAAAREASRASSLSEAVVDA
jgi:hypothetical protein